MRGSYRVAAQAGRPRAKVDVTKTRTEVTFPGASQPVAQVPSWKHLKPFKRGCYRQCKSTLELDSPSEAPAIL